MDGLNASQAVSNLLGYRHVNIPNIPYNRSEGAPSVAISFAVENGRMVDTDQVGQVEEPEQNLEQASPEHEHSYRSPDSDIWREEEQLYAEMFSGVQSDSQELWDRADLDTSVEQEPEQGRGSSLVDRVGNSFPRCQYHIA